MIVKLDGLPVDKLVVGEKYVRVKVGKLEFVFPKNMTLMPGYYESKLQRGVLPQIFLKRRVESKEAQVVITTLGSVYMTEEVQSQLLELM